MNHLFIMFSLLLIWPNTALGQIMMPESSMYLGQKRPDLVAIMFAPDLISLKDHYEYGSVFSKDG